MKDFRKYQSGQVALIMVLMVTVLSAIVVSLAGRATSETRIQNIYSDSSNAFLSAQSGIEDAIKKGTAVVSTELNGKTYSVDLTEEGKNSVVTEVLVPGMSMEIVLTGGENLTGVGIFWSHLEAVPSSLLVSVVSSTGIVDYAYDSVGANGFVKILTGGVLVDQSYDYATQIPLTASDTSIRLTVFGGSIKIGVGPVGGWFPVQTLKYKSTGAVESGSKKTVYGLEYEESKSNKIPEIFDYALFSYGSIIQ